MFDVPKNIHFSTDDIMDNDVSNIIRDDLNRKHLAQKFYRDLCNDAFLSPHLLDGDWGIGKTEFCHKFFNFIIKNNNSIPNKILIPVYINAFNAERINNPFLVLMAALQGNIAEALQIEQLHKTKLDQLLEKTNYILHKELNWQKLLKTFAKENIPLDELNLLSKTLFQISFKNTSIELYKQLSEAEKKDILERSLDDIFTLDSDYNEFKKILEEFATSDTPIVFIVDELDRCQPDFAIQIIEKAKYLFNVKNVNFIFSCDASQLLATINHTYGYNLNAENYLEKFFESKCYLTLERNSIIKNQVIITLKEKITKSYPSMQGEINGLFNVLEELAPLYSIRRIEKIIQFILSRGDIYIETLYKLLPEMLEDNHGDHVFALKWYVLLVYTEIYLYHSAFAISIISGSLSDEDFENSISKTLFPKIINKHQSLVINKTIKECIQISNTKFPYSQKNAEKVLSFFNSFDINPVAPKNLPQ